MNTGIELSDGSYIDVRQISYVNPDVRNWCTVVLGNGFQFECQDYDRIMKAIKEYDGNDID